MGIHSFEHHVTIYTVCLATSLFATISWHEDNTTFSHVGGEGGRVVSVGEQVRHVAVERGVWRRTVRWGYEHVKQAGVLITKPILMTMLIILTASLNM